MDHSDLETHCISSKGLIKRLFNPIKAYRPPLILDSSIELQSTFLKPEDFSFVGYTYKNFDVVKGLHKCLDMRRSMSPRRPSLDTIFGNSIMNGATKSNGGQSDVDMISLGDAMTP